ncbi:MAG: hypothetical protein JO100_11770 [Pseudonocardia sp.]|nr:hypothetical protein [Pseudonocardia sp.]
MDDLQRDDVEGPCSVCDQHAELITMDGKCWCCWETTYRGSFTPHALYAYACRGCKQELGESLDPTRAWNLAQAHVNRYGPGHHVWIISNSRIANLRFFQANRDRLAA